MKLKHIHAKRQTCTANAGKKDNKILVTVLFRKWGDVLEYAPPTRYSYPHGQCRSVGVGGYLLGGGVNWLGTYNKVKQF